jgi:hypothetical protein
MKMFSINKYIGTSCIVLAAGVALSARAAALSTVPMQGGMDMLMVAYHAGDGSLSIMVSMDEPQLTPLLVSNPGYGFDPGDPWYDFLDPSRQGLSFSRRYGFDMDTMSDALPDGTAINICALASSPGLGAYRYRSSIPKAWEPIFGTAGSTNKLQWDLTMFHPAFTAPPGTNTYAATFELVLVNTSTGLAVPGASTGPFTLTWTDAPDGRPTLNIAPKVMLAWQTSATNYALECSESLTATNWTTVTNTQVLLDGQTAVFVDPRDAQKFFRMRLGP